MDLEFTVPSIVCDRCAQTVTQAIQGVDGQAQVTINVDSKQVKVHTIASLADLTAAIENVGHEIA